jgi:hypothetical protein
MRGKSTGGTDHGVPNLPAEISCITLNRRGSTLSGERILSSLSIGALVVAGLKGASLRLAISGIGPTEGRVTVEGGVRRIERGVSILAMGWLLSESR